MTLGDLISRHSSDRLLVRSASGDWTTKRLLDGADAIRNSVRGARVAVRVADAGEGLRAIALLDGAAAAVVLVAPSVPLNQLPSLFELAGVQAVVADDSKEISRTGFAAVANRIDDIGVPQNALPQNTAWILTTSGTSGDAKLVAHTFQTLARTTKTSPVKGDEVCWGLLYEWPRFAGLQVLLQSVLSGSVLIAPSTEMRLEDRIALFAGSACTHLSATPTMWRRIVMVGRNDLPPLRQVSLGGEIADDKILRTLRSKFFDARITHIYASTEAGVGFSVNDGRAGFPESYLANPPAGLSLRVVNGRLQLGNPGILPLYVGTGRSFGTDDGWIDSGDSVRVENGRVYFLGRDDGIINVGGNKVHPEEVERVLLNFPGVVAARVFGKHSAITGSLVVAEVVCEPTPEDRDTARQMLQRHALANLQVHKVPALISFVSEIKSNAMGKTVRGKA
jgi:acyl-coenzyme A synthetase/AMP-(fatty) acid ligase